jgi:hypothetical protein
MDRWKTFVRCRLTLFLKLAESISSMKGQNTVSHAMKMPSRRNDGRMEELCSRLRHLVIKLAESISFMKRKIGATTKTAIPGEWKRPNPSVTKFELIGRFCARPRGLRHSKPATLRLNPRIDGISTDGFRGRSARSPPCFLVRGVRLDYRGPPEVPRRQKTGAIASRRAILNIDSKEVTNV